MKKSQRTVNIFWIMLGILLFGYTIYGFTFRILNDYFVDNNAIISKATIIDERNYYPNQNVSPEFSYSYQFEIDGKKYKGNSHDKTLTIGDTIEVKYYRHCPYFNKPVHPKD